MSTIKVINAIHPSGSTTNIVNDASGNVTIGNNLTSAGTVVMGSSFLRNRIINGDMRIDQRNAGASVTQTTAQLYTVDRWMVAGSVTTKFTAQQNAGSVTPPAGFSNYLGCTSSSAYSVLTGDYFYLRQCIEGFNFADMAWGTVNAKSVTLSFYVYSSLTGSFGAAVFNSAANRSYPFSYTVSSANTWTQISVTIPGDTTGTWVGSTNGIGLQVNFSLGCGATYSGTANTWAGALYLQPTGSQSVVGTNGATFYITGVQLEVGSVATPFERRQFAQELMLCQRYYEMSIAQGTTGYNTLAGATNAVAGSTNDIAGTSVYKVTKRATPTVVPYSTSTGTANAIRDQIAGADVTSVSTEGNDSGFRVYKTSAFTIGRFYSYGWNASAEL